MSQTQLETRAVLLDMDGTLVDSSEVVERLWLAWAEPHGLPAERVLEVVHGRQGWESMALLLPGRDEALNRAENEAMLAAESADLEGVIEVPGAAALLAALSDLPHALVTSADDRLARARMGAAALAFPAVAVTAEAVTASKPHPEGFLRGAELLGFDPADCVVFEDSAAGIAAGRAAGMRVIGVGERSARHGADHTVVDLTAVTVETRVDGMLRLTLG